MPQLALDISLFDLLNGKYKVCELNPIQDGLFWGCWRMERGGKKGPHPKICHAYPTMMKLGIVIPHLKRPQKYMNHVTHTMIPADISNFLLEISKFCYIKKYMYRSHFDTKFWIILAFLESLRIVLIKKLQVWWWGQQKWLP